MLLRIFVMYVQNTFHLQTVSKQNMIILPKKLNTISLQTTINKLQLKNYVLNFFCSRGTLLNHFKSKYNTTIHQYLLNYRLKKATELLINDELNVKEIAYFCGFEDPNYFSKVFKKRYGRSPLEFKNNINQ